MRQTTLAIGLVSLAFAVSALTLASEVEKTQGDSAKAFPRLRFAGQFVLPDVRRF